MQQKGAVNFLIAPSIMLYFSQNPVIVSASRRHFLYFFR